MYGADVKNAQPGWGRKVIHWLCGGVVGEGGTGMVWLWVALGRDVPRIVVGGLGGIGIWPELRVVRREGGGVRVPIIRI